MRRAARWAILYAVAITVAFSVAYVLLRVRELGLALLLVGLNLPASAVVVPWMGRFCAEAGMAVGAPPHVVATQLAATMVNTVLVFGLGCLLEGWRRRKGVGSGPSR